MPLNFISQIAENDKRIQQLKSNIEYLQQGQSNKVYSQDSLFYDYSPASQGVIDLVASAL